MPHVSQAAVLAPAGQASPTFDALFPGVVETAYGVALCLAAGGPEAFEVLQEAAATACRGFAGLAEGTDFRLWFLGILTGIARESTCRDEPGGSALDLDDTPDLLIYARSASAGLPTSGDQPAAELLDRLGSERVMAALRRLPREYRIVCTLSLMADLTYEEIARVLEYPVGTVRSRLHRGRKMLQKALWTRAETDGLTGRERRTP